MTEGAKRDKRGKYVRAMLIVGVCAGLAGCAARAQRAALPSGTEAAPDRLTERRLLGEIGSERPLLPEPGNIWADVQLGKAPAAPERSAPARRGPPAAASVSPARPAEGAQVQLAAGASRARAEAVWRRLERREPELVRGHAPEFEPASVDGRQVWRLRVGGFANSAEAARFCAAMAKNRGPCWVAGGRAGG